MIIMYVCNNDDCKNSIKKYYRNHNDIVGYLDCGECGIGKLERQLGEPTTKTTQIIDNGVQARQVELMDVVLEKEIQRLNEKE